MIYFVQPVEGGNIKIGTTISLRTRKPTLEKEAGCSLAVLGVADGSFPEEGHLHKRFRYLRVRREWFSPGEELLAYIQQESRPWVPADEPQNFTGTKIDVEVLRLARAACALEGIRMQDWLSDLANEAASKMLGRKPIKRKPKKPNKSKD